MFWHATTVPEPQRSAFPSRPRLVRLCMPLQCPRGDMASRPLGHPLPCGSSSDEPSDALPDPTPRWSLCVNGGRTTRHRRCQTVQEGGRAGHNVQAVRAIPDFQRSIPTGPDLLKRILSSLRGADADAQAETGVHAVQAGANAGLCMRLRRRSYFRTPFKPRSSGCVSAL